MLELRIFKRKMSEKLWMFVAWRLPKKLVLWSAMRLIAHATQGKYGSTVVPELSAMEAIERWEAG